MNTSRTLHSLLALGLALATLPGCGESAPESESPGGSSGESPAGSGGGDTDNLGGAPGEGSGGTGGAGGDDIDLETGGTGGDVGGDICDPDDLTDSDDDGVADACDNCPAAPNANQANDDDDDFGDACDVDIDGDGLIEVSSLEQLDWIRNATNGTARHDGVVARTDGCRISSEGGCNGYELTQDLDFDTNENGNSDAGDDFFDPEGDGSNLGWLPIDEFHAEFEGNGHAIKNLRIARPMQQNVGLFGSLRDSTGRSTVVRNLVLDGPLTTVSGRQRAGLLVGYVYAINSAFDESIQIDNVHATGSVGIAGSANVDFAGGIAGVLHTANYLTDYGAVILMKNSTFSGTVTSTDVAGGVVGQAYSTMGGRIELAGIGAQAQVSIGAVTGDRAAGGVVGWAEVLETDHQAVLLVERAYSSGSVTGSACVGGLFGRGFATNGTVSLADAFSTSRVTAANTAGGVMGCITGTGYDGQVFVSTTYVIGGISGGDMQEGTAFGTASGNASFSDSFYSGTSTGAVEEAPFVDVQGFSDASLDSMKCAPSEDAECSGGDTTFATFDATRWNFGTSTELPGLVIDGVVYRPVEGESGFDLAKTTL